MFQKYYKFKVKHYSTELEKFDKKNLSNLKNFNDAVIKYSKFKLIYDKASQYISKLPYGHIDSVDSLYSQVKNNLDSLYNKSIIDSLKNNSEIDSLKELEKVKTDLNNSYGYGFDTYISLYQQSLHEIINKHKIIFKNYKNNLKEETSLTSTLESDDEPLYNKIVEFCIETGKVSASILQRKFRLGYNRASRCIDLLEERGIVGPANGANPRKVLINYNENIDYIPHKFIDFVALYGTDYEEIEKEKQIKEQKEKDEYNDFINNYIDNAQKYFDEKKLNIKFNKNKRINKSKLNNTLYTNTNSEDVEELVNNILSMSVPNEIKLLLIDYSRINLYGYNGLVNLYAPVISDYKKAQVSLNLLVNEMKNRYELFLEQRVKNIDAYNDSVNNDYKLPYIIVIINEIYDMLKFENTKDIISELLLNCKKAGIIIICFSKFNKKNIQLMMLDDLFDIHSGYTNSYIDSDNKTNISEINNIDNDMDGFDFEKYTGKLLKSNGFTKVEITQSSNDFGVDVIAYKDDIKYAIQCKKYSAPVGIKAVQEVIGSKSMNDCHVAVVLTNNTFTKSAKELAEKNNVLLWDRNKLIKLIENMNK